MNTPLRVLHLEDSRLDAELIQSTLRAGSPDYEVTHAKNREEFETVLGRDRFDVILCDYVLPGYDGLSALEWPRSEPNGSGHMKRWKQRVASMNSFCSQPPKEFSAWT